MSLPHFQRVLSEFGQSLGIDGLAPNDMGAVTLRVYGDIEFNLVVSPDGQTVTAFLELGALDEDAGADAYQALLQANYFWQGTGGGTLGLHASTNTVVMAQKLAVPLLTAGELEQVMQRFVEFAERGLAGVSHSSTAAPGGDAWSVRV